MEKQEIKSGVAAVMLTGILFVCGCYESYATPQAQPASMRLLEDQSKNAAPGTPNLQLPATLAIARIQSQYYGNTPGFHIINNRALESKIDMSPIRNQKGIRDMVILNSLLASGELSSSSQLRASAKSLKADVLLVYTIDTQSEYRDNASILSVFSLGMAPTVKMSVTTTITAVLIDTQTGFLYGTFETTSHKEQTAAAMTSNDARGQCQDFTEKDAMTQMINRFPELWNQVLSQSEK